MITMTWKALSIFVSLIFSQYLILKRRIKNLIISSPNFKLIKVLEKELKKRESAYLGNYPVKIESVSLFKPRLERQFITSTPLFFIRMVERITISQWKDSWLSVFMDRLKENALKKYNSFYDEEYYFEGNIFDRLEYGREVAVRLKKADKLL